MTIQPRLIPDLDQELTTALARVEEMLLIVAAWEHDEPEIIWPEPLAQRRALAAVRRLWDAIAPTQGHRAAASHTGRMFAPDGRYEHIPLRLAAISPGDPAILADAVAVFAGPDASDHVRQALEHGAEIAYNDDSDQACTRLLRTAGRLAGLLSVPSDHDSDLLAALIAAALGREIVLSVGSEAAYRRYTIRTNQIWQAGDPLHLWHY
jgi:hypothetical protein